AQRDGNKKIVIVDLAILVAIEVREILREFDPALLKDLQQERRVDLLELRAGFQSVSSSNPGDAVGELQAVLPRFLRHAEGCSVLQAWEGKLWAWLHRCSAISEVIFIKAEAVHCARRQHSRPGERSRLKMVVRTLP